MSTTKTWSFEWQGGGYNVVQASSRTEALKKAQELGKPGEVMKVTLKVNERTLSDDPIRLTELDRKYCSFD